MENGPDLARANRLATFEAVTRRFGNVTALDGLTLDLEADRPWRCSVQMAPARPPPFDTARCSPSARWAWLPCPAGLPPSGRWVVDQFIIGTVAMFFTGMGVLRPITN